MSLRITPFPPESSASVASWPIGVDEARAWAGQGTVFPVTPEKVIQWHEDSDIHPFVGVIDGNPVAYAQLWIDRTEGEIELARIIVDPACRGMGLGCAFVRLLLHECESLGQMEIILRVCPGNAAAMRCYAKAGFKPVGPTEESEWNKGQPIAYRWMRYGA